MQSYKTNSLAENVICVFPLPLSIELFSVIIAAKKSHYAEFETISTLICVSNSLPICLSIYWLTTKSTLAYSKRGIQLSMC